MKLKPLGLLATRPHRLRRSQQPVTCVRAPELFRWQNCYIEDACQRRRKKFLLSSDIVRAADQRYIRAR